MGQIGSISKRSNPGRADDYQREAKEILNPDSFDGFRVELSQPLSNNLALTHSFVMGSESVPPHYQFGANYLRSKVLILHYDSNKRFVPFRLLQQGELTVSVG